jgi:hypothetical protein
MNNSFLKFKFSSNEFFFIVLCFLSFIYGLSIPKISATVFLIVLISLLLKIKFRFNFLHLMLLFVTTVYYTVYVPVVPEHNIFLHKIEAILFLNLAYFIFSNLNLYNKDRIQNYLIYPILFLFFGLILFGDLSSYKTFLEKGVFSLHREREFINYWSGNEVNSPFLSIISSVGVGGFFAYLFFYINNFIKKENNTSKTVFIFIYFILYASALIVGAVFTNRSIFAISIVSFLATLFYYITKLKKKRYIAIFFYIFLIIVVFYLLLTFNKIYVNDIFSNLITRFDEQGIETKRYLLWLDGLRKMFIYPFGGFSPNQSIDQVPYFHNSWLDIARYVGIAPAMTFLLFQLIHFYYIIKLRIFLDNFVYIIILNIYLSFMLISFVEPVQEASLSFMVGMMIFLGLIRSVYKNYKLMFSVKKGVI